MTELRPARRGDLTADALTVAPRLLGGVLTCRGVAVRLTEVEAYRGGEDPGSHAFRGRTPRTAPMFELGGHLYVYFTYGMHVCANVVTGTAGTASAVLLRAGEVLAGEELARARSGSPRTPLPAHRLASGPGRLARALGLTLQDSGVDLLGSAAVAALALAEPHAAPVAVGPRVGVAGDGGDGERYPWRFWLEGDRTVSPYRPARPRRPRSSGAHAAPVVD